MALEFVGTFVLSNEALDRSSQRILASGLKLNNFKKNAVMFYNHLRTASSRWENRTLDTANLPIGVWKNVRQDGTKTLGDAYIDTDDENAIKVGKKIKSGVLKAVSVGIRVFAYSDAPEDKVKGQKGLTITKSELVEASIVDIPSNPEALLVKSIDSKGNTIFKEVDSFNDLEEGSIIIRSASIFDEGESEISSLITKSEQMTDSKFNLVDFVKSFFKKDVASEEEAQAFLLEQKADENNGEKSFADAEALTSLTKTVTEQNAELTKQIQVLEKALETVVGQVTDLAKSFNEAQEAQETQEVEEKSAIDLQIEKLSAEIVNLKTMRKTATKDADAIVEKTDKPEDKGDKDTVIAKNSAEMIELTLSGGLTN